MRKIIFVTFVMASVGCVTPESGRTGEGPVDDGSLSQSKKSSENQSQPVVYGESNIQITKKPCPSDGLKDDSEKNNQPTIDVGVKADISKKGISNKRAYSMYHCDP